MLLTATFSICWIFMYNSVYCKILYTGFWFPHRDNISFGIPATMTLNGFKLILRYIFAPLGATKYHTLHFEMELVCLYVRVFVVVGDTEQKIKYGRCRKKMNLGEFCFCSCCHSFFRASLSLLHLSLLTAVNIAVSILIEGTSTENKSSGPLSIFLSALRCCCSVVAPFFLCNLNFYLSITACPYFFP